MVEKYLMVSLEDEKAKCISEVLGNKTCKKILDFLSEKESTETEIAKTLKLHLNTVDYNIKKLMKANLIEKSKNYFWSTKGKKIPLYKVSNKFIVISPKSRNHFKPIVPAVLISCILTFLIWFFSRAVFYAQIATESEEMLKSTTETTVQTSIQSFISTIPSWAWFLTGALIALTIYIIILIITWKKLLSYK